MKKKMAGRYEEIPLENLGYGDHVNDGYDDTDDASMFSKPLLPSAPDDSEKIEMDVMATSTGHNDPFDEKEITPLEKGEYTPDPNASFSLNFPQKETVEGTIWNKIGDKYPEFKRGNPPPFKTRLEE